MVHKNIKIEIVYAQPNKECLLAMEVKSGCTIEKAIHQSGILTIFPDIDLAKNKVGVFAKLKELSDVVCHGDRIEIYRPLLIDPKEARRKKAKK